MNRRRILTIAALIVAAVFVVLFIAVGIPFIQATFSTPVQGLPTTNAASTPLSLQARFTQTALAKQTSGGAAPTPAATP